MLRPLSTDDIKKQDLEIDRCCQGIQSFFNLFGLDVRMSQMINVLTD